MLLGREFHTEGAEEEKRRFPNRLGRVREMISILEVEEHKDTRDGNSARREMLDERHLSQKVKTPVG